MAGVVETTHTFANNEVITSTLMNNIIDETLFTSDALANSTLALTAGKIKIATSGITSNEMGANAVTTSAILDGSVTPAKLSNSDFGAFTVASGVATLDDGVVTPAKLSNSDFGVFTVSSGVATLDNAVVSAAKLDGAQTGSAPVYGVRAWATFDSVTNSNVSGTYSRSGTTVTITVTGHGLIVGNLIFIDYTAGVGTVAPDGMYLVNSVVDANTFTVISAASVSGTNTGTVVLKRQTILASGNVSCVSASRSNPTIPPSSSTTALDGYYVVNFSTAMSNANFSISGSGGEGYVVLTAYPYNAQSSEVFVFNAATNAPIDSTYNSVIVIG